jgi:hypothetical protein
LPLYSFNRVWRKLCYSCEDLWKRATMNRWTGDENDDELWSLSKSEGGRDKDPMLFISGWAKVMWVSKHWIVSLMRMKVGGLQNQHAHEMICPQTKHRAFPLRSQ